MSAEHPRSRVSPTRVSPALRWSPGAGGSSTAEALAIEAPLALEIAYARGSHEVRKPLAVTMRTPGHDEDLALGFLLAEGLIARLADVTATETLDHTLRGEALATQRVRLAQPPRADLVRLSRGFVTSSACGLCGRPSLEGLPLPPVEPAAAPLFTGTLIARLPDLLRRHQPLFAETGGTHGAAVSDAGGALLLVREDVGRHNAVDKLVGAALRTGLALATRILVLSGRASFELVQKAAAAGFGTVVAVGAPSSLAVSLAHDAGVTLIGFTRDGRFNVYAHAGRLALAEPVDAAPMS